MEPPGPHLPAGHLSRPPGWAARPARARPDNPRPALGVAVGLAPAALARLAAAAGASASLLSLTGDVVLAALLVGVAAGAPWAVAATTLAAWSAAARFGSPDLAALAGAQAVLGPAGQVGPSLGAASSWVAVVAVIGAAAATAGPATAAAEPGALARRAIDRVLAVALAIAAGALAAILVAGPEDAPGLRLAVTAGLAGVVIAASGVTGRLPSVRRAAPPAASALGACAVVLALAS